MLIVSLKRMRFVYDYIFKTHAIYTNLSQHLIIKPPHWPLISYSGTHPCGILPPSASGIPTPPPDGMTDACENITSPQLLLRAVIKSIQFSCNYPFLLQVWTDEWMKWNPRDHHGVNMLKTPAASIWLPDIVLRNRWVNVGHSSFSIIHKVGNIGSFDQFLMEITLEWLQADQF